MSFPTYEIKPTSRLRRLFFGEEKEPYGWEDLGEIEKVTELKDGEEIRAWHVHSLCNTIPHVYAEGDERGLYCPRCMVKLTRQYMDFNWDNSDRDALTTLLGTIALGVLVIIILTLSL